MDEEDYRALIAIVSDELRQSGAPDISHERNYTFFDPESGEARLIDPQKRLVLMLEAFERHVAIQDRSLLEQSLGLINRSVRGDGPRRVTVELANDGLAREVDLAEAPDMRVIRQDLKLLIARLRNIGLLER